MKIFTIGHSTRRLEEFITILESYQIKLLIDIRKLPGSNKFPHFNKEVLEVELPKNGIEYLHFPELGGFRKGGYLTFTKTDEFQKGIAKLLKIIDDKTVALMCAEILWFRCHRRYVSEELAKRGYDVTHIYNEKKTQEHKLREPEIEQKMQLKIFCDKKS